MDPFKKNSAPFQRLGDVLQEVLQQFRGPQDEGLVGVWHKWEQAVGTAIAQYSRPSAFKGKLLIVQVTNSTWIHHLQFLKQDIIQKLNETLGADRVEDIRFKIGTVSGSACARPPGSARTAPHAPDA